MLNNNSCDSLGTRTLPICDQSVTSQSECTVNDDCWEGNGSGRVSKLEILPVNFSDVSIFGDYDNEVDEGGNTFECTLAIIKPEIAHLMYKVESIIQKNGFIIKTVELSN